jgi:hypothetical protein
MVLSSASLSVGHQPGRVGIGASRQHYVAKAPYDGGQRNQANPSSDGNSRTASGDSRRTNELGRVECDAMLQICVSVISEFNFAKNTTQDRNLSLLNR